MSEISTYYDRQFIKSEVYGSIYEPMTPLVSAAHHHRMAVLDSLEIGSLDGKTVVDFGTGSWGFACIYPKLHSCGLAIGIDISSEAIKISEAISAKGTFPYKMRFEYYISDGINIPLMDGSVDLFFTGECIEHVENTDAFLDEIYRILKPGGTFILTTPNPQPILYRSLGDIYAVGPEHIALMSLQELLGYLEPRFQMTLLKGYNTSMHRTLDDAVRDVDFARRWAAAHEDYPQDACGFIAMGYKKDGWQSKMLHRETYSINSPELIKYGTWTEVKLHESLYGILGKFGSHIGFKFFGIEIIVLFWCHDWSGIVDITVDDQFSSVDLFSTTAGFKRVVIKNLDEHKEHRLAIVPVGKKNVRSIDDQVIFYTASTYCIL